MVGNIGHGNRDGAFDAGGSGSPFLEGRNLRSLEHWRSAAKEGQKPTAAVVIDAATGRIPEK
ncbi:MAG: hypothetical protein ACLVG5_07355 [Clostridium sp.]